MHIFPLQWPGTVMDYNSHVSWLVQENRKESLTYLENTIWFNGLHNPLLLLQKICIPSSVQMLSTWYFKCGYHLSTSVISFDLYWRYMPTFHCKNMFRFLKENVQIPKVHKPNTLQWIMSFTYDTYKMFQIPLVVPNYSPYCWPAKEIIHLYLANKEVRWRKNNFLNAAKWFHGRGDTCPKNFLIHNLVF